MSNIKRALPLLMLTGLVACNDTKDDTSIVECTPVANAGEDQAVSLNSTVLLDASGSTLCSNAVFNYVWAFESVPVDSGIDVSLLTDNNSETAVSTRFTPDVAGTYVLSLILSNATNESPQDLVVIDVTSGNLAPIADCGDNSSVEVNNRAELDGSSSYDPEGAAISYSWSLTSVPSNSSLSTTDIFNSGGATPTVIPDVAGTYLVALIVTDGELWSDADYCTITASSDNQVPIADAGVSGNKPPCTESEIQLNGYGSYDPEGEPLTYSWSVITIPAESTIDTLSPPFDDVTIPDPTFIWDVSGTYTFQLSVSDGVSWSAPDIVTYEIASRESNRKPVSNAGDNQTIETTADCTSASYVYTCDDCEAETAELDGTGSYDPDGDELNYHWTETTGGLVIDSPYASYTLITTPVLEATYGTANTVSYEVNLDVSDCEKSDSDKITVTLSCTGQ